jgi:hypothetical protein
MPRILLAALAAGVALVPATASAATIAYDQGSGISTVPSTGGTPTLLIKNGALPSYSPNGKQLAYFSGSTLYVASADGSGAKAVVTAKGTLAEGGPAAWSPNGKQLAYSPGGERLYVVKTRRAGRPGSSRARRTARSSRTPTTRRGRPTARRCTTWAA